MMKNWINTYLSKGYLLNISADGKYEIFYLVLPIVVLVLTLGFRLYIFFKGNRPESYKSFDRWWFWGFVLLSSIGLFVYFSRTQELPFFATRLFSYLWILSLALYLVGIFWYLKTKMPVKIEKYYESRRKAKYLKR